MQETFNKKTNIRKRIAPSNPIKTTIISDIDYIILLSVVILVLFGVVMVFSASYYNYAVKVVNNPNSSSTDVFYLFRKQITFAIIGFVAMITMSVTSYKNLKRLSFLAYLTSIVLLVLVLIIGVEKNNSRRWLSLFGFEFQPAEIAKVAVILFISFIVSKNPYIFKYKRSYITLAVIVFLPVILIGLQVDLSTALVILVVGMVIAFVASPHVKIFFASAGVFLLALLVFLIFGNTYHSGRFFAYLNPASDLADSNYQPMQALYAIASGGFFGLGLGQSRQKLGILPEVENDMIFPIICEELGLFGAAIVLILFATIVWRGIKIAINANDLFGCYVATGITTLIAVHVIVNVGVTTGILPNTGLPLPFISAGGTSLIIFMALIGILLNIGRYSRDT